MQHKTESPTLKAAARIRTHSSTRATAGFVNTAGDHIVNFTMESAAGASFMAALKMTESQYRGVYRQFFGVEN